MSLQTFERSLIAFILWLVSIVVAFTTGASLFFNVAYLLGGMIIFSFVWSWLNISWLKVSRQTFTRRVQVGQVAEERFSIENKSYIPKLWVEFQDQSELPNYRASFVISGLKGKERYARTFRVVCLQRGRFRLGPIVLISGDPFGLFIVYQKLPLRSNIIVYPLIIPLPYFRPLVGELIGGESIYRRTHQITTNVSGIREYAPGDSFNRIHWPSTAKRSTSEMSRLMVKEFELDPMADVWIVMDMARAVHVGTAFEDLPVPEIPLVPWEDMPEPEIGPSTEEYTIVVTASLAHHFIRQNKSVGMITYSRGGHCEIIQEDRGERQENRILETLAVTHPQGRISLHQVLIAEGVRFTRNTTLVIVTPSVALEWVSVVQHFVSRGVKTTTILIDPSSFVDATVNTDDALEELLASHIPTYIVRNGDRIDEVLESSRGF